MRRRFILFSLIILAHIVAVFGPMGCYWLQYDEEKQRDIAFKVELGGLEPSHAPEIGPPERRPVTGTPGEAPPPAPPSEQPDRAAEERARQQAEQQRQREAEQRRQAEQQRQRQEQQRQRQEQQRQREAEQRRQAEQQRQRQEQQRRQAEQQRQRQEQQRRQAEQQRQRQEQQRRQQAERERRERERRERESVHTDPNAGNFDPNKRYGGGSNTNQNVRSGRRDAGQARGEVDSRTPAGGATREMAQRVAAYKGQVVGIINNRWHPPAGVFITRETAVQIEVTIDTRGRFTGRIIRRSPNEAVNRSVEEMLRTFSTMPVPPERVYFTVTLIQEN